VSVGEATTPRWVDTDAGLAEIIDQLGDAPAVALDTEFHRERTYFPKLALVQLSYEPDQLVLIDPLAVDLAPMAKVLESDTTVVIHAASQDLEVLRLATGTVPRNLFDTQIAAGFLGYSNPSLAVLHTGLLDIALNKSDRLTDWLVRPLPARVLDYAADDVRYLLTIHERLVAELAANERLEWALSECDIERDRGAETRDPDEAWRRVKGAGRLRGRAAAVARTVAAWRERRAAEIDIPIRHVLGDLALVSIAQRPPHDVAALGKVRGLDSRALKGDAAAGLLEAVAAGEAAEPPAREPRSSKRSDANLGPAVALVSSWLTQYAHELRIDTQLLATRKDIEHFVEHSGRGRLADGWRRDLVGRPMQDLLDGNAALAFDPERGIVLEPRSTS
jgi:ribonuclease D